MKLNPNCVRDILISIENIEYNTSLSIEKLHELMPAYSEEVLNYHCLKLLEAEYIQADSFLLPRQYLPRISKIIALSYNGHQFLENIRSDTIWKHVINIVSKIGISSLPAITQISSGVVTALIKAELGLT